MHIKPASVSDMLEKLKSQKLIKWAPRKAIRLTEKGKAIAKQLNKTHRLLNRFFKDVLKIKDDKLVDKVSCEIEHHITQDVHKSLKNFLDRYLT